MKRNLRSQTDDELVEAYRDAAAVHGVGTVQGDRKLSNAAAKLIERIYKELGSRGARQKLLSLLDSDDAGVQSWVGAHALEIAPERGVQVLESLARQTGLIAFSAAMTLKTWRDGALRFP